VAETGDLSTVSWAESREARIRRRLLRPFPPTGVVAQVPVRRVRVCAQDATRWIFQTFSGSYRWHSRIPEDQTGNRPVAERVFSFQVTPRPLAQSPHQERVRSVGPRMEGSPPRWIWWACVHGAQPRDPCRL